MFSLSQLDFTYDGVLLKSIMAVSMISLFGLFNLLFVYSVIATNYFKEGKQFAKYKKFLVSALTSIMFYLFFFPFIFSFIFLLNGILSSMPYYFDSSFLNAILKIPECFNEFKNEYFILFGVLPIILMFIFTNYPSRTELKFKNFIMLFVVLILSYSTFHLICHYSTLEYWTSFRMSLWNTIIYMWLIYDLNKPIKN